MRTTVLLTATMLAVMPHPAASAAEKGRATSGPASVDAPDARGRAPAGWWRAFDDPVLAAVVEHALAASPTLEIASARFDQAAAAARATRASLLPSLAAGASAAAIRQSLEDPAIRPFAAFPGFARDVERYDARLSASWEIDLFGAGPRTRAARARLLAARADAGAARIAVAADAAAAYFNVRELQERLAIAAARSASLDRQRRALRLRVDAGTVARLDLDRFDAEAQGAAAAVPAIEALLAGERARLGVLAGDAGAAALLDAPRASASPDPAALPAAADAPVAIERRPDVVAAAQALAAADADVAVARSQRFPRLSLAGLIATVASAPAALFTGAAAAAQGQGGVFLPLFDFGRIDAGIAQARGGRREALASYRLALLRAAADVEAAAVAVARRNDEAARRDAAVRSAARAETAARRTYAAGALDLTALLDTERAALAARENAAVARAGRDKAMVALFRATASSDAGAIAEPAHAAAAAGGSG